MERINALCGVYSRLCVCTCLHVYVFADEVLRAEEKGEEEEEERKGEEEEKGKEEEEGCSQ